ncbi:hypothetical protein M3484_14565 [Pseudomonas sp. GX19020]|uniref:hypothetical protein n=1 Tax=Pseudomonas sp. GX19020 TaxID=2942277 RepID=UPI00201A1C49|nr:hypothetical protein [Pseudomonas sp. GX19020]MCL4067796.1 hypothetical protein [Pseudomonas sp. GX19020]
MEAGDCITRILFTLSLTREMLLLLAVIKALSLLLSQGVPLPPFLAFSPTASAKRSSNPVWKRQ